MQAREDVMPILRQIAQLGQPVLRGVAGRVADPHDPVVQTLIEDLLVTVADANGVAPVQFARAHVDAVVGVEPALQRFLAQERHLLVQEVAGLAR